MPMHAYQQRRLKIKSLHRCLNRIIYHSSYISLRYRIILNDQAVSRIFASSAILMKCYNVVVLCFIDAIITKDKQRILLHTSVALCKNIDDNDKTILSDYIENTCPWNVKRYPEVVALKQKPTKYSPMIISTSNNNWFLLIRQWKTIIRVFYIHTSKLGFRKYKSVYIYIYIYMIVLVKLYYNCFCKSIPLFPKNVFPSQNSINCELIKWNQYQWTTKRNRGKHHKMCSYRKIICPITCFYDMKPCYLLVFGQTFFCQSICRDNFSE